MRERVTAARRFRRPAMTITLLMAVVALVTLAVAGPLAAKRGVTPKAKGFTCLATVKSVDVDGRTITATVIRGNRAIRASVGSDVVFAVRTSARIIKTGPTGPTAITLADLTFGDRVFIRGKVSATGVFKAALVVDRTPPVKSARP